MRFSEAELRILQQKTGQRNFPLPDLSFDRAFREALETNSQILSDLASGNFRRITLRFSFDLNTALANALSDVRQYARAKRNIETIIYQQIEKEKPVSGFNHYVFLWITKDKRKDPDNVNAGRKVIFDAMNPRNKHRNKLIPNDSRKYIGACLDFFFVDKQDPRVEMLIIRDRN